jgi:hypothetical protein
MYVQDFVAAGTLNFDAAERISWKSGEYSSRIHLVVNGRRLYAHLLPLCWDELDIHAGTPISITVDGGIGGADDTDERRALVEVVDYFQLVTASEPSDRRSGHTRRRFWHGRRRFD